MTLKPGTRLGAYEVTAPIGSGGMGEVWRATDSRLGREVAIKALPEGFSDDSERLARFEREAHLLASLNHPNIASIYGVEETAGRRCLVLELVEGESLDRRIAAGPLPVEEALDIACQIARALEAAHEKGIIHRDLKPANVKSAADGTVKVLDFGLAKATQDPEAEVRSSDMSLSPTITVGTRDGMILGTAPYMSPEQARGKPLDKRTDIWSFGCILYECLTGTALFKGETVTDTLSAILQSDPAWSALPANTPPRVRSLIESCLEKHRKDRLHDIADARIEIERSLRLKEWATTAGQAPAAVAGGRFGRSALVAGILIGSVAGAAVGWLTTKALSPGPPDRSLRKVSIARTNGVMARISPDGRRVAYISEGKLLIRELDRLEPREIPGVRDAFPMAWSPDSEWLVLANTRELLRIHVEGGGLTVLARLDFIWPPAAGAVWHEDGSISFTTGGSGLMSVPSEGGEVVTQLEPDEGEVDFHDVTALPGDRGVLFIAHHEDGRTILAAWAGGVRRNLTPVDRTISHLAYSSTGHLLATDTPGSLWAFPFSLDSLDMTNGPFRVTERAAVPSLSEDGTLVYHRVPSATGTRLVRMGRDGERLGTLGDPGIGHQNPAVSSDGGRVAFSMVENDNRDVWILDTRAGTRQRLTLAPTEEDYPAWKPGEDQVAFEIRTPSNPLEVSTIKLKRADGSGDARTLIGGSQPAWGSDGRTLLFNAYTPNMAPVLSYVNLATPTEAVQLDKESTFEWSPRLSPNGRFLAYTADVTGRFEVYLRPFPHGEGRWQVSEEGGENPCWSPDGSRLYFTDGGTLLEAAIQVSPSVRLGRSRALFSWNVPVQQGYLPLPKRYFDLAPDGESFVVVESVDPEGSMPEIVVVENWFVEFARRAAP